MFLSYYNFRIIRNTWIDGMFILNHLFFFRLIKWPKYFAVVLISVILRNSYAYWWWIFHWGFTTHIYQIPILLSSWHASSLSIFSKCTFIIWVRFLFLLIHFIHRLYLILNSIARLLVSFYLVFRWWIISSPLFWVIWY